jgi:two-component system LytT family response regulator
MNRDDAKDRRLKVAIVDDEAPARSLLREYLSEHDDIDVVAECSDGFLAVKAVHETNPDLLLLDIQMPKLNGFEVLEMVGPGTAVIFTTAHDEYALKAFQVHAVDYLLKPFSPERLAEALQWARARVLSGTPMPVTALIRDARKPEARLERIVIRDRGAVHVVPVQKIDYIEAQDDYVGIHTNGRMLLKEQTLAWCEHELEARGFVRIHRRYLLNLERLARLEQGVGDNRIAILADGTELPVSRGGFAKLKALL